MTAYYNEFDPFAAAWLRELMKDGLIPDGVVDERSILEVQADEIRDFTQCHFFAGIGGWSYALQLAGWPSTRPVWTGSPPCQPFSTAGKRRGSEDERHLWPAFFNLIRQCRPPTVFGEQVAAAIRDSWFDALRADMEAEGYATGMVVLPACSVGAPHKRDRLWFVANAQNSGHQCRIMGDQTGQKCATYRCGKTERSGRNDATNGCESDFNGTVGDTNNDGCETGREASAPTGHRRTDDAASRADSHLIYCRDGKHRPIPAEPALFPLADGIPNRVGILRGAGNAIVPQIAAEVIKSFLGD